MLFIQVWCDASVVNSPKTLYAIWTETYLEWSHLHMNKFSTFLRNTDIQSYSNLYDNDENCSCGKSCKYLEMPMNIMVQVYGNFPLCRLGSLLPLSAHVLWQTPVGRWLLPSLFRRFPCPLQKGCIMYTVHIYPSTEGLYNVYPTHISLYRRVV